jgi:hypothetical protein
MFEHGDEIAHQKLTHDLCRMRWCIVVKNPSPPLPNSDRTEPHDLSNASNFHVEGYVESLTLRCEFVAHNSVAVKNSAT